MKRLKILGVAAMALLLWTGCASVAHIEKDDTVNFHNYRTFAWVETKANQQDLKTEKAKEQKTKVSDLTERNIRQAVNAELEKAGWQESKTNPDVLLSYDVLVEKSVKQQPNPVYTQPFSRLFFNPYSRRWVSIYYPSRFMGYADDAYAVREGTITISMIDAKTDKTIWQGWTTDEVNSKNLTNKEVTASIKSIFRKFDVAKK